MHEFSSIMEAFEWLNIQGFVEEFHFRDEGYWHRKSKRFFSVDEVKIIDTLKAEDSYDLGYSTQLLALLVKKEQIKGYYLNSIRSTESFDYVDN